MHELSINSVWLENVFLFILFIQETTKKSKSWYTGLILDEEFGRPMVKKIEILVVP